MLVRNIGGTGQNSCGCDSWLDHYRRGSGISSGLTFCSIEGCYNAATVGAHVQISGSITRQWFIVPMCESHNRVTTSDLSIPNSTPRVSASVEKTCGQQKKNLYGSLI